VYATNRGMKSAPILSRLYHIAVRLVKERDGTNAVEYALVALLIAVAIAGTLPAIAPPINATFSTIASKL
jgi:Flp pilus assembly pilin Flp